MYDINNLNCMIECLEKYKHEYTKYEHRNGKCSIRTDLLLKQLKLNEKEIRAKAIDDFFDELQKYEESDGWLKLKMSSIYEIAEQIKEGER